MTLRPPELQSLRFGNLKVRPKLMVLHNTFFLVLAFAVYFSLFPLVEQRVAQARARELNLIAHIFAEGRHLNAIPGAEIYDYREGTAAALSIPADLLRKLDDHPGQIQFSRADPNTVFVRDNGGTGYGRLRMPNEFYEDSVRRARWTLLAVLAIIYILAVLLLELIIMPRYVYRPIRAIIAADEASRRGERDLEMIDEGGIPGDEIGQIMRSRNSTVGLLRQHEDELGQTLQKMADQERLVSLGLLSASVAHEINTPLAVLHGSIEKLIETVHEPQSQERLSRMLRVTQRLRKMSASLLDFARVRRPEYGEVNLREVIEESWNLVGIDEKAQQVRFEDRVPEDARVRGDQDRLVQLFVNLLRNALQAIRRDGLIRVGAQVRWEGDRPWMVIAVEDDGPGIPEKVLHNIFEAFVTTKLDARGTGLGLTVAEGIVSQHGGTIAASNRPQGGARLEVKLTAIAARPPAAAGAATERKVS